MIVTDPSRLYMWREVVAVMKLRFKPGDTVRVVGSRGTAKIRAIPMCMHGALLDKHIDGFRCWN